MTRRGTGVRVGLVLGLVVCGSAFAQGLQPNGFKMGEGRLHLFGEVEGRFDSLVGYFQQQGVPSPEIIFVPRAGLSYGLDTPSTSVKFGGSAEYLIYSGILQGQSSRNLSRAQGLVSLETAFNKEGAVEVDLTDSFSRSDRTQNPSAGIGIVSLFNALSLATPIRPGGRALEITPRVTWGVEFFEPLLLGQTSCPGGDITCDPSRVSQMNYSNLNFALGGRYRFLPKTSAILDANFDYRTYWAASTANPPANILRGRAGLAGLITPRFSVTLLAGAAYDFASTKRAAPIGLAELTYLVGDSVSIGVGYTRDMMPVPAFGTFSDDRGYLNARVGLFSERLTLNGTFSVDYFTFFSANAGPSTRQDLMISGFFGPSFVVTSWFVISGGYGLGFRNSSLNTQTGINFVRHEANLRLTFRY